MRRSMLKLLQKPFLKTVKNKGMPMPEQINSLSPNEIINFIENNYSESQLNDILKIFLRAEHTIADSKLLKDLLNKNIMCLSFAPYLSYRFEKYFSKHGIEKISKRKEFIFSKIPNFEGLHRGKAASYDDLINFIEKKFPDLFLKILSEIQIYDFSPAFKENGRLCTLYFNRKLNPKANYKYDSRVGHYVLKDDEVTNLLREHGVKFEVDNPDLLFSGVYVSLEETSKINNNTQILKILKICLLIIFWPVGLYYLIRKKNRSTNV